MKHAMPSISLALLLTVIGCGTTMYSRPMESGESAARIATIVAVDLLEFDGKKPVASGVNNWKVTGGRHHLTVQVKDWQTLRAAPRTAAFGFEQNHDYQIGFRGYNEKTIETPQGKVQEGDWEIAVYDTTSKCVVLESGASCHPADVAPWARGWFWSL